MTRIELLCLAAIVAVVAIVAFPLVDMATGVSTPTPVTVIEKVYSPARTGVGIGAVHGGQSGSRPGSFVTVEGEDYRLIIRDEGGKVFSREVKPEEYAAAIEGQPMSLRFRFGGITGWRY